MTVLMCSPRPPRHRELQGPWGRGPSVTDAGCPHDGVPSPSPVRSFSGYLLPSACNIALKRISRLLVPRSDLLAFRQLHQRM
ncbi:hypothetical protein EYF80_056242 [Liparis tanakae]|uniref:Uncharacterized protein n=1 Tax=Liparis tanakae TaxID=230148 RepID=A0A4Z2EXB3_9TELE|nr:hypothetical protein EYF80_056242 [Liparis tanakae]